MGVTSRAINMLTSAWTATGLEQICWKPGKPLPEVEPEGCPYRHDILQGIKYGFAIFDHDADLPCEYIIINNYKSALSHENIRQFEDQIEAEIAEGNYTVTATMLLIVSALGAIPNPGGGVWLINDATSSSHNDMASTEECCVLTMY